MFTLAACAADAKNSAAQIKTAAVLSALQYFIRMSSWLLLVFGLDFGVGAAAGGGAPWRIMARTAPPCAPAAAAQKTAFSRRIR
ncbi:MAG: hypothetical protein OXU94_00770 [Gammaproteobacteria bacterium]|nr:hypothetical protein [Gammaproteobacteria bacterium]